jgi:hypothetical protein
MSAFEPDPAQPVTVPQAARLLGLPVENVRYRLLRKGLIDRRPVSVLPCLPWGTFRRLWPGPLPLTTARRGPSQEALDALERVVASMRERA